MTLCHYIYIYMQGCFRVCEVGAAKVMHCVFKVLNIPNIPTYIWPLLGGSWLLAPLIDLQWRAQPWARGVKVVHWNFEHHIPPFSLIYIWATCWCGCLLTLPNIIFCCKDSDDPQQTRGIISKPCAIQVRCESPRPRKREQIKVEVLAQPCAMQVHYKTTTCES